MKPQMKRDIVTSVLVGIGAFVIMMAIALASPSAHASCESFSNKVDWEIFKCEDLNDDSKFFIAFSDEGNVRQRGSYPYSNGSYELLYRCGISASQLHIYATGGVNLNDGQQGKLKFDRETPYTKSVTESTNLIGFDMSPSDWERMIRSDRLRVWMPYYGGDVVVDFSLYGFTKAAKQISILNGCDHSDVDEILESQDATQ